MTYGLRLYNLLIHDLQDKNKHILCKNSLFTQKFHASSYIDISLFRMISFSVISTRKNVYSRVAPHFEGAVDFDRGYKK